jgi:hypothetical protein
METKHIVITALLVLGTIALCSVAFVFIMRGALEVAQEFNSFQLATPQTSLTAGNLGQLNSSSTQSYDYSTWKIFTSPDNTFSISFPEVPLISHNNEQFTQYRVESKGEVYELDRVIGTGTATPNVQDIQAFITGYAQSKSMKVTDFVIRNNVYYFTLLSKDTEAASQGAVVVHGDSLYLVIYSCNPNACSNENKNQFVNSLMFH